MPEYQNEDYQNFTATELKQFSKHATMRPDVDFADGEDVRVNGWNEAPLELWIKGGNAPRLMDGNTRVNYLVARDAGDTLIPVLIRIVDNTGTDPQPKAPAESIVPEDEATDELPVVTALNLSSAAALVRTTGLGTPVKAIWRLDIIALTYQILLSL